jgi:two-component system, chemotaxis family, protein-glutamate methylesterase/glutaminase
MGMPSFSRITYSLLTGLLAVKACDGVAIVQDPNEALYPGMPRSALENVKVDYCLPLSGIAARLVQLANESVEIEGAHAIPEGIEIESKIAQMEGSILKTVIA